MTFKVGLKEDLENSGLKGQKWNHEKPPCLLMTLCGQGRHCVNSWRSWGGEKKERICMFTKSMSDQRISFHASCLWSGDYEPERWQKRVVKLVNYSAFPGSQLDILQIYTTNVITWWTDDLHSTWFIFPPYFLECFGLGWNALRMSVSRSVWTCGCSRSTWSVFCLRLSHSEVDTMMRIMMGWIHPEW